VLTTWTSGASMFSGHRVTIGMWHRFTGLLDIEGYYWILGVGLLGLCHNA
jgi:hypothetical protein